MSNSWFRMYNQVAEDPKVQRLSLFLFRAWVNILCISSMHDGILPDTPDLAYRLRVTQDRAESIVGELIEAELLDRFDGDIIRPHNWNGRQFQSDVSTERVKRFRNAKRNVSETPDETDQSRTDTEQIQNRAEQIVPPSSPKRGKTDPPKDFELTDEMREWAAREGFSNPYIQQETAAMIDHFRANGERKLDWVATWRNWLRRSRTFNKNGARQNVTKNDRTAEAARRLLSRMDSQDSGSIQRGSRRGDLGDLSGTAEALISGSDPDGRYPNN